MANNRGKFPAIVFGNVAAIGTWTLGNTPIVTTGQADPVGGTGAVKIEDDDGAQVEGLISPVFLPLTSEDLWVGVFVKEDTAATTVVRLRDDTAGITRVEATLTWSTEILSITFGAGVAYGVATFENGWRYILFSAENIVAGNDHEIRLFPASGSSPAATGASIFYIRNTLIVGEPLDQAVSYSQPRDGSRHLQAASGVEDAWITGRDELLEGGIRWIPTEPQGIPRVSSPWNGAGEVEGINTSFDFWLEEAQCKKTFLWVPNRSLSTVNVSSFLVNPLKGRPGLEQDFTRILPVAFRSENQDTYLGY